MIFLFHNAMNNSINKQMVPVNRHQDVSDFDAFYLESNFQYTYDQDDL